MEVLQTLGRGAAWVPCAAAGAGMGTVAHAEPPTLSAVPPLRAAAGPPALCALRAAGPPQEAPTAR